MRQRKSESFYHQATGRDDTNDSHRRSKGRLVAALFLALWTVGLFLNYARGVVRHRRRRNSFTAACSPLAYDSGRWVDKHELTPPPLETLDDVYSAMGVQGCKAKFQPTWNLGLMGQEPPFTQHARKLQYEWMPHPTCRLYNTTMQEKLQLLVDRPVLLAGDSRSRQHFFQLSCELGEHVVWKGAAPPADDNSDITAWRFQPQHLLLNQASPLAAELRLGSSFDWQRPLMTFIMAYIPLSREEMRRMSGPGVNTRHIPESPPVPAYPVSELPMNKTIDLFVGNQSHYKTMIHSTGAHFGPVLFRNGFQIENALALLRASLKIYYGELSRRMRPDQRVFVRAAEAGQTECDTFTRPLDELDATGNWFNYGYIQELNGVSESESALIQDPRFSWLALSRLTRLRPDAHLPGDCIHFTVGSGVYEAISRYIWHHLMTNDT